MAQRNGEDSVSRTVIGAYPQYKEEADKQQHSVAEISAYQPSVPYPSPRMQNTYPYAPSQDPMLQLPPIKSVEGYTSAQPQYQPAVSSCIDRDSPQTVYYQTFNQPHQYPPTLMDALSSAQAQHTRHPLQPAMTAEDRMIASDNHRKEIKRRTKTGCLTCRKRRIKCDETHPVCRNCQKSKRECAGYDPLFRQQASPQSLHESIRPDSSSRTTPLDTTPETVIYTTTPHGYGPATSSKYRHQSIPSYPPRTSTGHNQEYQAAIDPALAGSELSRLAMSEENSLDSMALKNEDGHEQDSLYTPIAGIEGQRKRTLKIDDLYMIGGVDPPTPKPAKSLSPEMLDQIKYLYTHEYAKGIDYFLETTWYASSQGLDHLLTDTRLCEMFAGMLELFSTTKSDNYDTLRLIPLTESRFIWLLMCLSRTAASFSSMENLPTRRPVDPAVLHRLSIFEHLITNRTLPSNPLADSVTNPSSHASALPQEHRCNQFWRELGQLVTYMPSQINEIDASLSRLRLLLDMIENRDVLYSIAIVRRLGPACESLLRGDEATVAQGAAAVSEEDRSKVLVAKKFIEDEAAGKGTTQVVQRVCGMAVRSWAGLK